MNGKGGVTRQEMINNRCIGRAVLYLDTWLLTYEYLADVKSTSYHKFTFVKHRTDVDQLLG